MTPEQLARRIVRPLVWGPYPNPVFAGPDIAVAKVDAVVPYFYQAQRDPWAPSFMAYAYPEHGSECWASKGHPTLAAAQAAAEADYRVRILAALDLSPVLALVGALQSIAKQWPDSSAAKTARAALATLKESAP